MGSSVYIHSEGQNDEMCTSIVGKEHSAEPCTLLATSDGWRRVLFPLSGQCCKFCNTTQECGIVRPDWLQDNATYQGRKEVAGMTCDGWMKRGGEENYWWAQVDTQQPALYYEGYPTLPQSSNYWRFIAPLFSRAPLPASACAIPPGCDAMCNIAGSTYRERVAARWAAGVGGILRQAPPPAAAPQSCILAPTAGAARRLTSVACINAPVTASKAQQSHVRRCCCGGSSTRSQREQARICTAADAPPPPPSQSTA